MACDPPPPYGVFFAGQDYPGMSTASDIYRVASQSDEEREEERVRQLVQLAVDSSVARTKIEETFTHLTKELSQIVSIQTSELFFPRVKELHQLFRLIVLESKDLALEIAHYAEVFEDVIIPLCGDESIPIEERKEDLQMFINDAQDFIDKSHRLSEHVQNLRTDCSEFARSFSSWTSDRKAVNEASLGKLEAQLRALDDELSSSCIHSWVSGIAGIVMIAGCVIFPQFLIFAAPVGIACLCYSGYEFITRQDAKKCRNDKEAEIRELRRDNSEIDETRSRLEDITRTHIKSLDDSIPVLSEFWASTRDDAFKIKQWLSTGAKVANRPRYMNLNKPINKYKTMANYLNVYADKIGSAKIPPS